MIIEWGQARSEREIEGKDIMLWSDIVYGILRDGLERRNI